MKHLDAIIGFVKSTGASGEDQTDRDGILSYHAESHALGIGIGAGYAAVVAGQLSVIGILYGVAVHGRLGQSKGKRRSVLVDVKTEPQYTLGGAVVGGLLGALTRLVIGRGPLPLGLLG